MNKNLIEYIDDDFYIGTWKLSKFFEVEHRSLQRTIKSNFQDILDVGETEPKNRVIYCHSMAKNQDSKTIKRGRPIKEFLLNEPQATFVVLLLKGQYKTDGISKVVEFKKHLTKEFFKQRKILSKLLTQKQNVEWLAKRATGKLERREETDTIKKFVEYSIEQGSENSQKYYMIISKMENQSLFHLDYIAQKIPNIREVAEGFQLDSLKMADRIVAKAIREGMEKSMYYKDIFQLSKERIKQFANALGKTPLQYVFSPKQLT